MIIKGTQTVKCKERKEVEKMKKWKEKKEQEVREKYREIRSTLKGLRL